MCQDSPACSSGDALDPPSSNASPRSPLKPAGGFNCRRDRRQRLQGLHCYLARTVVTVAASAAMLEAMPEGQPDGGGSTGTSFASCSFLKDLVADVPVLLRSVLRGAAAYARDSLDGLAAAAGEPPRRPFEDAGAPSWLPWAVDAAIVCGILAVVLFALAFAAMPRPCGGGQEAEPGGAEGAGGPTELAKGGAKVFRVVMMAVLPAVSGALLNVKHVLVPALLCGL
ncbi:unnamed protein product [Prorocentrum cordatum]|uniref:Amino acid transporter n=1 Tax=Prorocentrum cordatum TaxID=2364126 RepID=A0ABN9QJY6_9DINO|nr:unnamed protein product [Polarella glacialis]